LDNLTPQALVIVDELGRGTSNIDGNVHIRIYTYICTICIYIYVFMYKYLYIYVLLMSWGEELRI
jgi:dolichol kinase